MIFLDNASTTRCYEKILDKHAKYLCEKFFNPSALYTHALEVEKDVATARNTILSLLGGTDFSLVFCGSATEANNMAIASGITSAKAVVMSAGEHPSVYECVKSLGNRVSEIIICPLTSDGVVDFDFFSKIDFSKVGFVSIIHTSNETGAINDIGKLCSFAKRKNPKIFFHSDGVQSFGKIDFSVDELGIDYYTISAHKIHGPKGVGALAYKKGTKLKPLIVGGGQEGNLRSGTENVAGIIALAECAKTKFMSLVHDFEEIKKVREDFINQFKKSGIKFILNSQNNTSPYILSISIPGLRGEVLVHALEKHDIIIGTGSACSSKKSENRTLMAMNRSKAEIEGNIRISFSVSEIGLDCKKIVGTIVDEIKNLVK